MDLGEYARQVDAAPEAAERIEAEQGRVRASHERREGGRRHLGDGTQRTSGWFINVTQPGDREVVRERARGLAAVR